MRARVTNLGRGARGFSTADGGTALLEPGASADLDLADHPAHDAWAASGEVEIRPEPEDAPPMTRGREKPAPRAPVARSRDT